MLALLGGRAIILLGTFFNISQGGVFLQNKDIVVEEKNIVSTNKLFGGGSYSCNRLRVTQDGINYYWFLCISSAAQEL